MKKRLPPWLKKRVPSDPTAAFTAEILEKLGLQTVCQSAMCPNVWECFGKKVATFMIMGDHCTRNCRFCGVPSQKPLPLESDEPQRVAQAVAEFGLRHVVITSVTRDDLPDGGAQHFAETLYAVREKCPNVTTEVLTPDFQGDEASIRIVAEAQPTIYNHNVETVPRLYPTVRPQANYQQSLNLLKFVKQHYPNIRTKSGMMLGVGESVNEVVAVMQDLRDHQCDCLTAGQYLQPSSEHLPVEEFIEPAVFEELTEKAKQLGFLHAYCGPFVRSSYNAGDFV